MLCGVLITRELRSEQTAVAVGAMESVTESMTCRGNNYPPIHYPVGMSTSGWSCNVELYTPISTIRRHSEDYASPRELL